MALINCNFFSEVLGISTSITVILPQNTKTQIGITGSKKKEKYPVLYLLHGLSDDHTIWQRNTSIERYVADMGIAVVMPNAGRSFYTDMKHGYKYWTYITEELPEIVASFFPISSLREDNFIAGLSMGGYGAFKAVLSHPEKYCAGASLSGALNMNTSLINERDEDFKMELYNIFGDISSFNGSENDLFSLASNLKSCATKPKLYQCCGTEDFLYKDNIKFKNFIEEKNFDYTYDESEGVHEWSYWNAQIQKVLKWLPIK